MSRRQTTQSPRGHHGIMTSDQVILPASCIPSKRPLDTTSEISSTSQAMIGLSDDELRKAAGGPSAPEQRLFLESSRTHSNYCSAMSSVSHLAHLNTLEEAPGDTSDVKRSMASDPRLSHSAPDTLPILSGDEEIEGRMFLPGCLSPTSPAPSGNNAEMNLPNSPESVQPAPDSIPVASMQSLPFIAPDDIDDLDSETSEADSSTESSSVFEEDLTSTYTASLLSEAENFTYENGRRYHSYREGTYVLPNDEPEQDRQDLLHHVRNLVLRGRLFHAPLEKNIQRVLDIGTGTGIWAIDFADAFPSAQVIGIDLSPIQPAWVPPNCRFIVDDAEAAWLYSRSQPFDYIHSRDMGGSISDWPRLLAQGFQHLRPGGWIELCEFEVMLRSDDDSIALAPTLCEFLGHLDRASARFNRPMNIARYHRQHLIEAGFENVHDDTFKVPSSTWPTDPLNKEIGKYNLCSLLLAVESYSLALFTRVLGWSNERTQVFLAGVRRELKNPDVRSYCILHVVYGRKPSHHLTWLFLLWSRASQTQLNPDYIEPCLSGSIFPCGASLLPIQCLGSQITGTQLLHAWLVAYVHPHAHKSATQHRPGVNHQQPFLWLIYSIAYAFFSPLRHFPGPFLWSISRIPSNISVLRGTNHLDILALHAKYGPVVRIGPNELAFNTPQAFRDIYGAGLGGTCFPKDRSHYEPPANGVDHLVCAVDDACHARQRRLIAHAFSKKALREQEGLIGGYVDTLITKLRTSIREGTSAVDIKAWMNFTTFDITGDLMFGESFDCLKDKRLHPWIGMIFNSMKAIAFIGVVNQFPALKGLLNRLLPGDVKRVGQEHFELTAQKVDKLLEANISRSDFLSAMLQNGLSEQMGQYDAGERIMTRAEIHSNGFMYLLTLTSLIVAGSETSATLLSGCIYYLCRTPRVMAKLTTEIRSAFTQNSNMTFRALEDLTYLAAVIDESLRMYPPFVTSLARLVPTGGALVSGHFVPERTVVACHHYASYHSESNFRYPDQFIPERWLGDPAFENDRKDVLQPFSLGPRACLGKDLANCEIRLILCKLLFNFDLQLHPESVNWPNQKVYYLWSKPSLMVSLKDRLSNSQTERPRLFMTS
ncbi:unnamed protein product [Penicillium salamii]|nr:unnamed protein product [Penicillium salamii]